jgi:DNA-binding NarL/FixJ family response regulator
MPTPTTELLLIEDDAAMRDLLATALEFEGFLVHRAADGRSGLDLVRKARPALVLCDVMMPGMDGYEVLAALRADPALTSIPFIFLTARGEKKDLRQGMVSGADDYLTKPVAIDDLLGAIHGRLARHAGLARKLPDFSDLAPLRALGLTRKESEVLLWVAQGKTNAEAALILSVSEATVKKHLEHIFGKLGVEKRGAASLIALEALVA